MTPEERKLLSQLRSLAKQAKQCKERMNDLYEDFKQTQKEKVNPAIIKQINETIREFKTHCEEDGA